MQTPANKLLKAVESTNEANNQAIAKKLAKNLILELEGADTVDELVDVIKSFVEDFEQDHGVPMDLLSWAQNTLSGNGFDLSQDLESALDEVDDVGEKKLSSAERGALPDSAFVYPSLKKN